MIKEAISKIEDMTRPHIHEDKQGYHYVITKEGNIEQILETLIYQEHKMLSSLDALVKMVKTEALVMHDGLVYIEANFFDRVECFMQPNRDLRMERLVLYITKATDVPGWKDDVSLPFEQALIAIRTRFQTSPDAEYLLRLLSEISCGAKITFSDNGIATTIVSQKGVALQENAIIRPIVTLKPYRTFQEVDQPASQFHIRVSERDIRFIESDGAMWKLASRKTVVSFLEERLSDEIKEGRVVVML